MLSYIQELMTMNNQIILTDFPKIECPFIRKNHPISKEQFQDYRKKYNLRESQLYLVTKEVNPGYEWVFAEPDTIAVEKLDGTNVKVLIENKRIVHVQNRMNVIDLLSIESSKFQFSDGIFNAAGKGYFTANGEYVGELLGPKINANHYKLPSHEWYPFERAISSLKYKSFNEHERTFENLSTWFKNYLFSLFYAKKHNLPINEAIYAEGVVFYNLKRKAENQWPYMAKLRRDMFDWYYQE